MQAFITHSYAPCIAVPHTPRTCFSRLQFALGLSITSLGGLVLLFGGV